MSGDLIERLLAAPEGSRDMSDEVLLALGWECGGDDGFGGGPVWTWPAGFKPRMELHPRDLRTRPHIPSPTESLEDAWRLVPPEYWFAVQQRKNTVRFQRIDNGEYGWKSHDRPMYGKEPRPPFYAALGRHDSPKKEVVAYGTAATPMLALCAAILQIAAVAATDEGKAA